MKKTFRPKKEQQKRQWLIFDAAGKTLGRFCSEISKVLRGKHKPTFDPAVDVGDGVIVLNAGKIKVTGSKEAQKVYRRYTGYIGGLRETTYATMKARKPDYIITHAVKGMMPKTRLGRAQLKRLRVFAGEQHDLEAQSPTKVSI